LRTGRVSGRGNTRLPAYTAPGPLPWLARHVGSVPLYSTTCCVAGLVSPSLFVYYCQASWFLPGACLVIIVASSAPRHPVLFRAWQHAFSASIPCMPLWDTLAFLLFTPGSHLFCYPAFPLAVRSPWLHFNLPSPFCPATFPVPFLLCAFCDTFWRFLLFIFSHMTVCVYTSNYFWAVGRFISFCGRTMVFKACGRGLSRQTLGSSRWACRCILPRCLDVAFILSLRHLLPATDRHLLLHRLLSFFCCISTCLFHVSCHFLHGDEHSSGLLLSGFVLVATALLPSCRMRFYRCSNVLPGMPVGCLP